MSLSRAETGPDGRSAGASAVAARLRIWSGSFEGAEDQAIRDPIDAKESARAPWWAWPPLPTPHTTPPAAGCGAFPLRSRISLGQCSARLEVVNPAGLRAPGAAQVFDAGPSRWRGRCHRVATLSAGNLS